jgi:hypothetical protein
MLMPLHDWSRLPEWEGVHQLWIVGLYKDIKSKLPPGYRAGLATVPSLTIGGPTTHPDVSVQRTPSSADPSAEAAPDEMSGFETEVTLLALDPTTMVRVYRGSDLVAAVELISPRNKDRESSRATTVDRVVGYLAMGVHVLFVDVHPAPHGFSLADAIAAALEYEQPPCPSPQAIAYRVGHAADGRGRTLAVHRAPLTAGQPLPTMALPLSSTRAVRIDLETTYSAAAGDYLSWLPSLNGSTREGG